MKPISLTISAFGSYEKSESIDFTPLLRHGIFLITGPTGGGKTTILDAISVALYGKPTGSLRGENSKAFRCESADRSEPTVVDYVFEINGARYRFYRRWRIGKKDGEDALKEVELASYALGPDGEWQLTACKAAKNLEKEAERVLGLTHDQFVKVICLPQGEFKELLTEKSKDRAVIFEKLFGTDRWKRLELAAAAKLQEIETGLQLKKERIAGLLTDPEFNTPQKLRFGAEQAAIVRDEFDRQLADAEKLLASANENLSAALVLESRFRSLDDASAQLERLRGEAAHFDELSAKYSRNLTLSELLPKYSMLDDARSQESKAQTAMAQCHDRLGKAGAILDDSTQRMGRVDELAARLDGAKAELALLRSVKQKADELAGLNKEISDGRARLEQCESRVGANNDELEQLQARLEKGLSLIAECDRALADMPAAVSAQSEAAQYLESLAQLEQLLEQAAKAKAEYDRLEAACAAAESSCADKKKLLGVLEQLMSADAAYDLSRGLAAGQPCPVCGSTEHPSPAPVPSDAPDPRIIEKARADLEAAQAGLDALTAKLSESSASYRMKSEQLSRMRSERDYSVPRAEAQAALEKADSALSGINAAAGKKREYGSLLDRLAARQQELRAAGERLNSEKAEIMAGLYAARGRHSALTSELDGKNIDADGINERIASLMSECISIDSEIRSARSDHERASIEAAEAKASMESARQSLDAARERRAAIEADYTADCLARDADPDCVIPDLLLDPDEASELGRQLDRYRASTAAAEETLSRLRDELSGRARPQVGELRSIRDALSEKTSELSNSSGRASQLCSTLSAAASELDVLEKETDILAAKYSQAKRMSDFLRGINDKKTPIDQFVAGLFLDEIITAANGYWNILSRGQYALRRREDVSGRNKYQGVDFEVLDAYIGSLREVCTLSGGEIFLASLALAFGLSDVVQSISGGIHLDSIFIDEGFGSLDHDSLETLMNAAGMIREGRLVGIISHVEELRGRIGAVVEVTKDQSGSHVRVIA